MTLRVKVRFFANNQRRPCADPEIAEIIAREFCSPWLIWGTDKVDRYLSAFAKGAGCEMRLHFDLTWAQARQHDFFVLKPKHVVRERDKVAVANMDYAETLPAHHVTEFGSFKIRDKVLVDKIKPHDDRIWSMDFCEAFIARDEIAAETLARFSGAHEAELLHYRTHEVVPGWTAFHSAVWLPGLVEDETTTIKTDRNKYIETYGLHAAEAIDLQSMPDIFRMPQVYSPLGDSAHAVRKNVMEYWHDNGIKKSFFLQPLLVKGTAAYVEYLELWREMQSALAANRKNMIA